MPSRITKALYLFQKGLVVVEKSLGENTREKTDLPENCRYLSITKQSGKDYGAYAQGSREGKREISKLHILWQLMIGLHYYVELDSDGFPQGHVCLLI
jgi:hypothetical protein